MTTASSVDTHRTEDFAERLVGILNDGALTLMISIGHRTGLFDVMADGQPRTVGQVANDAELNERYVKEWLGAVTVGGIVDHDGVTYTLPIEHAKSLSRTTPLENMGVFAQYIPILGAVEDDIVASFRHGGGVPYERFPRFHEVMEEDSGQSVLPALDEFILPLVPGLKDHLNEGINVADVGSGRGRALIQMASTYPASTFIGYDFSEEAISYARRVAEDAGLGNVTFEVRDAARLDEFVPEGSFDLVTTFDAVHDQADPARMLAAIYKILSPDGVYLAQDIDSSGTHLGDVDHILGPALYAVSTMHCMTVSLAQGGTGLGTMWGRDLAVEYFTKAGFGEVEVHTLEHDPQNAYYVSRK